MGCGASNSSITQAQYNHNKSLTSTLPSQQRPETPKHNLRVQEMSEDRTDNVNVLITCHANQQDIAEQLRKNLTHVHFTCYTLTNTTPESLVARANLIGWCDAFIVIISRAYQRTFFCMEIINYAKDLRKPIIAVLAESNFQPYGALGAIASSAVRSIALGNDGLSEHVTEELSSAISNNKSKKKTKNVVDPAKIQNSIENVNLIHGEKQYTVLICTVDDGLPVAQLIYNDFVAKDLNVSLENLGKPNIDCSIRRCSVFLPVLSPKFEQTSVCRAVFEEARRLNKPTVPVIAIKDWRPEGWLGLTIAGSTFFRIFDEESAYQPKFDSNRMTDLRFATEVACQPMPSEAEREKVEILALKAKIEECKSKLQTWPPPRKPRVFNPMIAREPVRVQLQEPSATRSFIHIHHTIQRMDIKAPPPMLDEYGLPIRKSLDCMISYQWDDQSFVRSFYEDMKMRGISAWFDIWGFMQGNTNDSMATGVECAKVLLVFLSKAYTESPNCQLEFRYAVNRGKAFVIIRTQPNIQLQPWMRKAIEGFPQYDIFSYNDLEKLINGVPTIDVITQAIRTIGHAQSVDVVNDCSAELFELRSLLDDARDAISAETGVSRFKTCTRCDQKFDEYTKGGCTQHSAYYVGGSILEGRWVCCRQQAKDGPGCNPCDHTDVKRVYTQDPNYGTWTWNPS